MGFWGWRRATWMAFISVLVVACTESAPTPPATHTPTPRPITLTLQGSPGAPPATPRATLSAVTATPDEADPAPSVEILPPQCLDTVNDGYQCIGLARNVTSEPLGTIWLHADLYDSGEIIETHTLALEQRLVPPESDAPYRFLFMHGAGGPLVISLAQGFAADDGLVRLAVRDATGTLDGADYVVRGTLINETGRPLAQVRALAALYADDRLLSFRVAALDSIAADASAEVEIRWYAVAPDVAYTFTLVADGIHE